MVTKKLINPFCHFLSPQEEFLSVVGIRNRYPINTVSYYFYAKEAGVVGVGAGGDGAPARGGSVHRLQAAAPLPQPAPAVSAQPRQEGVQARGVRLLQISRPAPPGPGIELTTI